MTDKITIDRARPCKIGEFCRRSALGESQCHDRCLLQVGVLDLKSPMERLIGAINVYPIDAAARLKLLEYVQQVGEDIEGLRLQVKVGVRDDRDEIERLNRVIDAAKVVLDARTQAIDRFKEAEAVTTLTSFFKIRK